jgi:hypothetical protein
MGSLQNLSGVRTILQLIAQSVLSLWFDSSNTSWHIFTIKVEDEAGEVVAEVQKVLHIRKKEASGAVRRLDPS